MVLIEDPQHRPRQQKGQKQRKDYHRAQDQGLAAIGDVFTRKDSLDDELFGAMRREHHHSATNDSHPDIERFSKRKIWIEPVELAGLTRLREDRREAAINECRDVADGKNAAGKKQRELEGVRPNDGLNAADVGVDQRQRDEEHD